MTPAIASASLPQEKSTSSTGGIESQYSRRAGDYFGEIALLQDVPRIATCTARTDAGIYSLSRDVFIAAVSGDMRSSTAAEDVMGKRLHQLESPPTSSVGDAKRGCAPFRYP